MEGRHAQLEFSDAFDRVSYRGLLYKLRSIGVSGQYLFIASEFLSDGKQRVRLDGKASASVDVVPGCPYCTMLPNKHSTHIE